MSKLPSSAQRHWKTSVGGYLILLLLIAVPTVICGVCIYVAATWKVVDAGPATISHPAAAVDDDSKPSVKVTLASGRTSTVSLQYDAYDALEKPAAHGARVEAYTNTTTGHVVTISYGGHHYGANTSKGGWISAAMFSSIPAFFVLIVFLKEARRGRKLRKKRRLPTFDAA